MFLFYVSYLRCLFIHRVSYLCDTTFFCTMIILASINCNKYKWTIDACSENGIFPNDYPQLHLYHISGWINHGYSVEKLDILRKVFECIHGNYGDIIHDKIGRSFSYKSDFMLGDAHICKSVISCISDNIMQMIISEAHSCRRSLHDGKLYNLCYK
jgi:hypothetical protein